MSADDAAEAAAGDGDAVADVGEIAGAPLEGGGEDEEGAACRDAASRRTRDSRVMKARYDDGRSPRMRARLSSSMALIVARAASRAAESDGGYQDDEGMDEDAAGAAAEPDPETADAAAAAPLLSPLPGTDCASPSAMATSDGTHPV